MRFTLAVSLISMATMGSAEQDRRLDLEACSIYAECTDFGECEHAQGTIDMATVTISLGELGQHSLTWVKAPEAWFDYGLSVQDQPYSPAQMIDRRWQPVSRAPSTTQTIYIRPNDEIADAIGYDIWNGAKRDPFIIKIACNRGSGLY